MTRPASRVVRVIVAPRCICIAMRRLRGRLKRGIARAAVVRRERRLRWLRVMRDQRDRVVVRARHRAIVTLTHSVSVRAKLGGLAGLATLVDDALLDELGAGVDEAHGDEGHGDRDADDNVLDELDVFRGGRVGVRLRVLGRPEVDGRELLGGRDEGGYEEGEDVHANRGEDRRGHWETRSVR